MELIPHQGISIVSILRGIVGLSSIILIAYLLSNNKRNIDWKTIIIGISSQFVIAIAVLKVDFVRIIFEKIGQGFLAIVTYTNQGSRILFGELADSSKYGEIFIFQVLPVIIFFSSLIAATYHLGIIQIIIKNIAKVMEKTMKTSGAETLSISANIFVGQTEAPILIRPYISKMTNSELMTVMVGGFSTVAGSVMALYVTWLNNIPEIAGHLLAAALVGR